MYISIVKLPNDPYRASRLRACSSWQRWCQLDLPGLDRPTSIDFGASTGPERPTSTDLGASTLPERPTSIDFASILLSIFIVFRGKIGRPTRRAARCAEPLILLAGAVLQRVGTHGDNAEKRRVSTKNRSNNGSRTSGAYELSRLSLLDTTWRRFWSPRRTPGRSWALPARKLDQSLPPGPTPIDPLRSTWASRGTPSDPLRSTWALRPALRWPERRAMARSIRPARPGSIDLATSPQHND